MWSPIIKRTIKSNFTSPAQNHTSGLQHMDRPVRLAPSQRFMLTRLNMYTRRKLWGLAFVLPAVIFFAIFAYYPIFSAARYSLTDYNGLRPAQEIGLANYEFLLESNRFEKVFVNTLRFVAGYALPTWIIGLGFALIFVQEFKGRGIYRTLYFMPILLSETVISIVWRLLYQQQGAINTLFVAPFNMGAGINWITDPQAAPIAVMIVSIWRVFGYYMIIFMNGLQNIPVEYYEAARVDGANTRQIFWQITMPLLRPTNMFVIVVTFITGFQSFAYQFLITKGGPNDATNVLGLMIYEEAFAKFNLGRASAMSLVLFALLLVLTIFQLYLLREREEI